jgi:hypothetical protein
MRLVTITRNDPGVSALLGFWQPEEVSLIAGSRMPRTGDLSGPLLGVFRAPPVGPSPLAGDPGQASRGQPEGKMDQFLDKAAQVINFAPRHPPVVWLTWTTILGSILYAWSRHNR